MSAYQDKEYLRSLLQELRKLPYETQWVEFKTNAIEPAAIGEYISALSNSAAIASKASAYMVWGIENNSHGIVGTTFTPGTTKKGNEQLENWILQLLDPKIHFFFHEITIEDKHVVILEIQPPSRQPVRFSGEEYIRIGSYKKKLKAYPEQERALWRTFETIPFESQIACERQSGDDVIGVLDYPAYFELLHTPLPDSKDKILETLMSERMIIKDDARQFNITNLGAILFAKKLSHFHSLSRKAVRVVRYKGTSRIETLRETQGTKGYASGFEGLIDFINNVLPANEIIGKALRRDVPMYPELAIRELVANAIIHQDFSITGTGPLIEIFDDRMEVTNPGKPLVDIERFLDSPPRSRNEILASFMRRIGVCEERGSGVDKVVFQTEFFQLPAPLFEVPGDNTRALLFAHKPLNQMEKPDRIRACYLHACLKYVNRENMTNTTLRERFGIASQNAATASRIIKETVEADLIRLSDPDLPRKLSKYIPFWA